MTSDRPAISSPANSRVKEVVRLRDRRDRDSSGLTIVDGAREIRRAVESGVELIEAFVHDEGATSADAEAALASLRAAGVRITPIGPIVLSTATDQLPVTTLRPANARSLCGRSLDWLEAVRT